MHHEFLQDVDLSRDVVLLTSYRINAVREILGIPVAFKLTLLHLTMSEIPGNKNIFPIFISSVGRITPLKHHKYPAAPGVPKVWAVQSAIKMTVFSVF